MNNVNCEVITRNSELSRSMTHHYEQESNWSQDDVRQIHMESHTWAPNLMQLYDGIINEVSCWMESDMDRTLSRLR
jgi:hypothetical protein